MKVIVVKHGQIRGGGPAGTQPKGLGDYVEKLAKPIAVALRLPCLDAEKKLRVESPCAKRREWLNRQGRRIGIGTEKEQHEKSITNTDGGNP